MIISHSKKFICLNPPKTGSGIREKIFDEYSDLDINKMRDLKIPVQEGGYRHFNFSSAKRQLEKSNLNISDYFVFTFVRNPWERVVSLANMIFNHNPDFNEINERLLTEAAKHCLYSNKLSSYYNTLTEEGDSLKRIDYIGSIETHQEDIKNIGIILNLNLKADAHTFRDSPFHKKISKFWTKSLIELTEKEEAETINLKGYTFNY